MKKEFFNNKYIILLCFTLFQLFTILTCIFHEPWFDEAQAWNIAKLSVPEIIKRLPYEQHPILWFLVLKFFQNIGLNYNHIWVISYLFTTFASIFAFFIIKTDIKIKLMFCFFGPLTYFYSAISREYCLIPILFLLLVYLHDKRIKYSYWYSIILVLLANTMILIEMFVLLVALDFIYELIKNKESKIKIIINFLLLSIGALIVIIPVFYGINFFPSTSYLNCESAQEYIIYFAENIPYSILILFGAFAVIKNLNKKEKIIASISSCFIIFFLLFIYGYFHQQKIMIVYLIVCYFFFISNNMYQKKMIPNLLILLYVIGGIGIIFGIKDIRYKFSDIQYIADFSSSHENANALFISNSSIINVSASNYNSCILNKDGKFQEIIYNHKDKKEIKSYEEFIEICDNYQNKDIYLIHLSKAPIKNINLNDFELIYQDKNTLVENIEILKYKY